MKLLVYPEYNIAYIQLKPRRGKVRSVPVGEELNVDVAADGSIYGIELLNANGQYVRGRRSPSGWRTSRRAKRARSR
jgi:uncharacterized protein YuzE